MSKQIARRKGLIRTPPRRNYMSFPRELREAIPDLHAGRCLELASVDGQGVNVPFFGPAVQLKLLVKETGKLTGKFVVRIDLEPEAARALAASLLKLANDAEKQ